MPEAPYSRFDDAWLQMTDSSFMDPTYKDDDTLAALPARPRRESTRSAPTYCFLLYTRGQVRYFPNFHTRRAGQELGIAELPGPWLADERRDDASMPALRPDPTC
jgi:hypothetical protein